MIFQSLQQSMKIFESAENNQDKRNQILKCVYRKYVVYKMKYHTINQHETIIN